MLFTNSIISREYHIVNIKKLTLNHKIKTLQSTNDYETREIKVYFVEWYIFSRPTTKTK